MQRRALFNKIVKSGTTAQLSAVMPPPTGTLDKYQGEWTKIQAAHLLRRSLFGFSQEQLNECVVDGLEITMSKLIAPLSDPQPPINYDFEADPDVPLGQTWVDAPYNIVNNSNNYRSRSFLGWTMGRILVKETNLREKMTLFWHNHFVTESINDDRFRFRYINMFRSNPFGNFKQMVKDVTIDPSMLRYLNGRDNTKNAPNENYGRELLELFTIGKGPLVGPGDYTNYTEDDVRAVSRALTGWVDFGYRNANLPNIGSIFVANRHDTTDKIMSNRFANVVITNEGENEYKTLIDIIFRQDEVAKFISRKLYRWFIYYKIDETVEQNIITPMAQLIRDNDYSIKEALETLLSSDHFFNSDHIGCMIKNPIDFVSGLLKNTEVKDPPADASIQYAYWLRLFNSFRTLQMEYYSPPSVAGWKAYYQEPSFYQGWLNAVTLPLRQSLSDISITRGTTISGNNLKGNYLELIAKFSNPYNVDVVIGTLVSLMLPKSLNENQLSALKQILLPGLPDYEWTVEYGDHILYPDNNALRVALENKLRDLLIYITRMPEYQLS